MSHRLLVNPGTPQAWEISLKPGVNRIGRGEQNDFTINHGSVSTHHCEVTVSDAGVFLKDLGSTNGSFVNRTPVTQIQLLPGQHVQFGAVDMTFESAGGAVAAATSVAPPIPIPVPVPGSSASAPVGLRINKPHVAETSEAPPVLETEEAAAEGEVAAIDGGNNVCKSHPKTPARFLCTRCRKYFCDLCVTTRGGNKYCRACGQTLTPLRLRALQPATERGFFSRLPGAFVYPFKGSGLLVLIAATILFAALGLVSGIFSILMTMMAIGYLYSFMQNIIHATAAEEAEMPELPAFDDLFSACFRLIGTVVICFAVPVGMLIAKIFSDYEISMPVIITTTILGCLYFPMAFLAVAMKDNIMSANPLVVIPAIMKAPAEYLVTAILLTGVFGMRFLGDMVADGAADVSMRTREMSTLFLTFGIRAFWSFCSVYLLTVNMRILGLLYLTKKHKLGWFSH
jgi:hypothetical protein